MKRLWAAAGCALIALATICGVASAKAPKRGTIFLGEAEFGYAAGCAFAEQPDGVGGRVTVGAGGKLKGFPTRFYGTISFTYAEYSGDVKSSLHRAETSRSWMAWTAGLKTLTPIAGRLRLLLGLGLGGAMVDSLAEMNGGVERLRSDDSTFLIEVGVGLQYRLNLHVSLGARADLAFPVTLEEFDVLAETNGVPSSEAVPINPSALATLTVHI